MLQSGAAGKPKHLLVGVLPKRFSREFQPKSEAKSFDLASDKRRPFPNLQSHDVTGVLIPYRKASGTTKQDGVGRINRDRKQSNDDLNAQSQRSNLR